MLKRFGILMGILGIGALCLLPNSLAATVFYDNFDDGNLVGWTAVTQGSGSVLAWYTTYYSGHYSMLIDSRGINPPSMAYATTSCLKMDRTKDYQVSFLINLPNNNNVGLYAPYNGHINCKITKYTDVKGVGHTNTIILYDSVGGNVVMDLSNSVWYRLDFHVYPGAATPYYKLYVNFVYKAQCVFFNPTALQYFVWGDQEFAAAAACYGSMFLDNVGVYQ